MKRIDPLKALYLSTSEFAATMQFQQKVYITIFIMPSNAMCWLLFQILKKKVGWPNKRWKPFPLKHLNFQKLTRE